MGNWSFTGIALIVGLFLLIFAFILTQIQITNPLTGQESNIWSWLLDIIV